MSADPKQFVVASATGAFAALAIAGFAGAAIAAPLPVETVSIERSTENYDVKVDYPKTGLAAVDAPIAKWATGLVDDFVAQAEEDFASFANGDPRPPFSYSLDLNFGVARNDDTIFAVNFDEGIFTGGAHPNHDIKTFNFLMPDGWQVFLPEIFEPAAVDRISEMAIADLVSQWDGDSMSDDDWLKGGAGPQWENFEDFLLLPNSLVIRFPPYQVAAYAAGEQSVELPLAQLKGLMRKDWRQPVPSYNCAKATTATEKTICSDVMLARLDRAVAAAYRQKLSYADEAEAQSTRDAQRAWIRARDGCGSSVLCLTTSYDDRLKALSGKLGFEPILHFGRYCGRVSTYRRERHVKSVERQRREAPCRYGTRRGRVRRRGGAGGRRVVLLPAIAGRLQGSGTGRRFGWQHRRYPTQAQCRACPGRPEQLPGPGHFPQTRRQLPDDHPQRPAIATTAEFCWRWWRLEQPGRVSPPASPTQRLRDPRRP